MTLQLKVRRVELEHIISILLVVEIYNAYQNLRKYRALKILNSFLESCLKSVWWSWSRSFGASCLLGGSGKAETLISRMLRGNCTHPPEPAMKVTFLPYFGKDFMKRQLMLQILEVLVIFQIQRTIVQENIYL